jgi:hypothetical protein
MGGSAPRRMAVLMAIVAFAVPGVARAGAVVRQSPFWFRDGYGNTDWVDPAATPAVVEPQGGGVILPYAPAQLSLGPSEGRALVATERGVEAALWNGSGVVPLPAWGLAGLAARGVTWLAGGGSFAVSVHGEVAVYGLDGAGAVALVARGSAAGIGALAPGPASVPGAILGQTATGAALLAPAGGGDLRALPGGPAGLQANLGVATAPGGGVAATWQAGRVELWVWDGSAYRPAPEWDPPAPPAGGGPVVGVAFFPQGGGYWVLTRGGQLEAYAYGAWGLDRLAGWTASLRAAPDPPVALASGWGPGSVAVLYPWGWTYLDPGPAGTLAPDAARGLAGQRYAVFAPTAVLQGVPIPVSHAVNALRVEDADCTPQVAGSACSGLPALPPGTALAYAVGAQGCTFLTAVETFRVVPVAPGSSACYRVTLSTVDPRETPRLYVTNLYEVAAETAAAADASLLCVPSTC